MTIMSKEQIRKAWLANLLSFPCGQTTEKTAQDLCIPVELVIEALRREGEEG
jgi:hypothetical protein